MDHESVVSLIETLRRSRGAVSIPWLSPVVATTLAALATRDIRVRDDLRDRLRLSATQRSYANTCGLTAVLEGNYAYPTGHGQQGLTYTCLTRLSSAHEVDACNAIINSLFHEQFGDPFEQFVRLLSKVVGELHDNVASHAVGTGFSSAQRYQRENTDVVQFAIADGGVGMLHNVRQRIPGITTDEAAIEWCLQRGNTTAPSDTDEWAQRLPDDFLVSPYPTAVATISRDDHHQGLGLWHLQQVVEAAGGRFWVASGGAQCRYVAKASGVSYHSLDPRWDGVAVEVELPISRNSLVTDARRDVFDQLAEKLGI